MEPQIRNTDLQNQSPWRINRWVMQLPIKSPSLVTPVEIAVSDSEKPEALADSLEGSVSAAKSPSEPAVIEIVAVTFPSYAFAPESGLKLTNPTDVHGVLRGNKVGRAPDPNGITNRALKHPSQTALSLLLKVFKVIFACSTSHQYGTTCAWSLS